MSVHNWYILIQENIGLLAAPNDAGAPGRCFEAAVWEVCLDIVHEFVLKDRSAQFEIKSGRNYLIFHTVRALPIRLLVTERA